jgi:DNA-binding NarL/FixJ family response regulator
VEAVALTEQVPEWGVEQERHLDWIARLPMLVAQLRSCPTVGSLFARAAEIACGELGFTRAVVLAVTAEGLSAGPTDVLADEPSDRLRRMTLAHPVPLLPGTMEAELVRLGESPCHRTAVPRPSSLATALELDQFAFGVVAPQQRVLALLVADRAEPLDVLDRSAVAAVAVAVAVAVETVILHARVAEIGADLRNLAASTQALMTEVLQAETVLPQSRGLAQVFPLHTGGGPAGPAPDRLRTVLTDREADVALLLAEGRSNRQIAEKIYLSPETVKTYVARILRKLGASNRVEAASRVRALRAGAL